MRKTRKTIEQTLGRGDLGAAWDLLRALPPRKAVGPLFSFLLSTEERVKWFGVRALGEITAALARQDREGARVIMRRLIWQLNDESGGIGWGCPEAMGEILARDRGLAEEFAPILLSFLQEEGNYLEYDPLRRGAVWGVGRLAQAHPDLAVGAEAPLADLLSSPAPSLRGLAAWALGYVGTGEALQERLAALQGDPGPVTFWEGETVREATVGVLAAESLARLGARR